MAAIITPLTSHNALAVAQLLENCVPELHPNVNKLLLTSLLAPGWRADLSLVDTCAGEVRGYLQAFPPRMGGTDGWVTLFAVKQACRRSGIAAQLFDTAESRLAQSGARRVLVSSYGPAYWVPGIDTSLFPEAASFLEKRGYEVISRPIAMEANLASLPARQVNTSVMCEMFAPSDAFEIADLLCHFSEDWQHTISNCVEQILKGNRPPINLLIARVDGRLAAFAHIENERFGPFGTHPEMRGMGIGSALLSAALLTMRAAGKARAYFLWTGEETARKIYRPAGFEQTNQWNVYAKRL